MFILFYFKKWPLKDGSHHWLLHWQRNKLSWFMKVENQWFSEEAGGEKRTGRQVRVEREKWTAMQTEVMWGLPHILSLTLLSKHRICWQPMTEGGAGGEWVGEDRRKQNFSRVQRTGYALFRQFSLCPIFSFPFKWVFLFHQLWNFI